MASRSYEILDKDAPTATGVRSSCCHDGRVAFSGRCARQLKSGRHFVGEEEFAPSTQNFSLDIGGEGRVIF